MKKGKTSQKKAIEKVFCVIVEGNEQKNVDYDVDLT
jgi:hypothetical protein